jgi:hypothetical protein
MKKNTRAVARNLQRGERRRGDILLQNQTARLSLSQILRVIQILPVSHLTSAAQVMKSESAGGDTPRRINASMEKESETAGARKDVESVTRNQSKSRKGMFALPN